MQHKIIALTPTQKGFVSKRITFTCGSKVPYKTAVLVFIQNRSDLHDCYILDAETLCPVTFDFTVVLKGHAAGSTFSSDQWACTYNQYKALFKDITSRSRFIRHYQPFCRALKSKSGKAGEFYTLHDNANFNKYREGSIPFPYGIFNSPAHFFK